MASQQRVVFFDNLKGVLIYLVVLGHFFSYLPVLDHVHLFKVFTTFIYSFHMPAFIFVSGLFASKVCTKEKGFKGENVLFYLALYLIFFFLIFIEKTAWGSDPSYNFLKIEGAPWYLLAMTIFTLMTPLFRRIKPSVMMTFLILAAMASLYLITGKTRTFLTSARVFAYAPYFAAGFYIGAGKLTEIVLKVHDHPKFYLMRAAGAIVLVAFLALIYFLPDESRIFLKRLSTGLNVCGNLRHWIEMPLICYALMRLLSYIWVGIIIACVMLITPRRKCILSMWGERSLQVYIVHMLVIYALKHYGFFTWLLDVNPLFKWEPLVLAPVLTAILALPKFPLTWTAALKRLCCKAVAEK